MFTREYSFNNRFIGDPLVYVSHLPIPQEDRE
jgi:hypothetical protein